MTTVNDTPRQPADLNALVELAQREHRAGRLAEAAEAYRQILAIRPDVAEVHNDLGIVLAMQGKFKPAAARLEQAAALRPDLIEAHFNLGNVLRELGKLELAAARFERAIALQPDYAEAHNDLALVLKDQGKLDQAVAQFERAIAVRPDYPDLHNNLGDLLLILGKLDDAAARIEHAIALRPDFVEARHNLARVLARQGQLDRATAELKRVVAMRPDFADAYNNLGRVLEEQGKYDEAVASLQRVIALRPGFVDAYNNLGNVNWRQNRLDQAAATFRQALTLQPDAEAYTRLGRVLLNQVRLDEAEAEFQRAIAARPDYAEAQCSLATRYLVDGDFQRGWPGYEARLRLLDLKPPRGVPRWTGQPLAGRSLLLISEQGLGDTMQFIRYARALKALGARVTLAAQPALGPLLASYRDLDELFLIGSKDELPTADYYLPLLSAPYALGTDAATIPGDTSYLSADPQLTDKWCQQLANIDGPRVGIAWQGKPSYNADRWRSIPLAEFAALARLSGVRLVSLQKGLGTEQIATVDFPVVDLSDRLDETGGAFMDTAAVIANLDLVITADTGMAHLAGALGAPAFVALHSMPDWRWLLDREDSPWYPTTRLFRQTTFGRWDDVFERIAAAVAERLKASSR